MRTDRSTIAGVAAVPRAPKRKRKWDTPTCGLAAVFMVMPGPILFFPRSGICLKLTNQSAPRKIQYCATASTGDRALSVSRSPPTLLASPPVQQTHTIPIHASLTNRDSREQKKGNTLRHRINHEANTRSTSHRQKLPTPVPAAAVPQRAHRSFARSPLATTTTTCAATARPDRI
jgi:hypothetical protein